MEKTKVEKMVDRFLSWPLPKDFAPDAGISFTPINHPDCWPIGTNLLTAEQARNMIEHMLAAHDQQDAAPQGESTVDASVGSDGTRSGPPVVVAPNQRAEDAAPQPIEGETPRTEALVATQKGWHPDQYGEMLAHARQLERELAEANKELDLWRNSSLPNE